jgi:hypothetical protein
MRFYAGVVIGAKQHFLFDSLVILNSCKLWAQAANVLAAFYELTILGLIFLLTSCLMYL